MEFNQVRRQTKKIRVKDIFIGGDSPISIQSMTNTDTCDFVSTIKQIKDLEMAGCNIVRITIPTIDATKTISDIKKTDISLPIVADIHFDYKIALECVRLGIDKIRINPGNIGAAWKVKEVVSACKSEGIPIRIGVNGGSLEKHILKKYGKPCADALAESAFYHLDLLEKNGFSNSIISVKSSHVQEMINANRIIAKNCNYPIHLGVTEAGDNYTGLIKSSIGIGSLLCDGIGDTIRVSLTADPLEEISAAKELLTSIGCYNNGSIQVISCPTCGRTKIDLIALSKSFKQKIKALDTKGKNIKVALMGCVVNGPGEAKECDIGVAGGIGEAILFKHGQIIRKIEENMIISVLYEEIERMINENE